MKSRNFVEISILKELLFADNLTFSKLKPNGYENSHLKFYLDKLLTQKLIEKVNNSYCLTAKGKEYANQLDTESKTFTKVPKVSSKLCCTRLKDNQTEFLLYKRLKQPFYNHIGFPTHKIWFGEPMIEAVQQGLEDECGLKGKANFRGTIRYLINYKDSLVEDKFFFIYKFDSPKGKLINSRDGEYFWTNKDDISRFKNEDLLPEFNEVYELLNDPSQETFFKEVIKQVDKF